MESKQLGEIYTEQLISNSFNQLNKHFFQLSEKLLKKYGYPKFIDKRDSDDFLSINFDVQLFCFTKSLRIHKSIDALIKIFNYEDAFSLLRSSYEAYVYIAFLNKDPRRVCDSIFKVGLHFGKYVHPINKNGKEIKNKILNIEDNNIYDFGTGIFEKASKTNYTEDINVHNVIYKFLCEHCHINFMSSGNYRDERKDRIRYTISNISHEQFMYLIFLKLFIYTNIFYEVQQQFSLNPKEKLQVNELIFESKRFIENILKRIDFIENNGNSINKIFEERISKIKL
jgi:hypothetical protein